MSLNEKIRYLYVFKKIINVIKSSLSKYIRNLLKITIIFNRVKYLQFCILIKISFIKNIKYRFLLMITFNFR